MNKVFEVEIKRNIEVYVYDMLVKSMEAEKHIDDLGKISAPSKDF